MIRNLEEKTGKPLAEWVQVARQSGLAKHKEILNHLKGEHGLTYGYANLVAMAALEAEKPAAAETDPAAAQYAGAKAGLRPIYDRIVEAVRHFGPDVEIAPKKAYVSLRRKKQFGLVQPSTATRVDVGLNLKEAPASDRLELSGSFSEMVSHRVRVSSVEEVDAELIGWLRAAYESA
jgi:predicted transport protein